MSTAVDGVSRHAGARTEEARLEAAGEFVKRVQELDRGELAALKRNAGNTLGEARGVMWFYRLLDDEDRWNPEIPFLVATLVGLNKYADEGDFGQCMRELANHPRSSPASVDRRFRILLDAQFGVADGYRPGGGELAYRLRQMVKLAASRQVGIGWAQLLVDLRRWNREGKPVQRRWAKHFYKPRDEPAPAGGDETNATQDE